MNEGIQVGLANPYGAFFRVEGPPRITGVENRREFDIRKPAPPAAGGKPGWEQLRRVLDCVVNYFGDNEDGDGLPQRLFSYHVIGSPGRTSGEGIAAVTPLTVSPPSERCTSCQYFHFVKTGGPEAAVAKALRYLDAYHQGDRLRKVLSEVRSFRD
jgi:hypothetical protein